MDEGILLGLGHASTSIEEHMKVVVKLHKVIVPGLRCVILFQ